MINGRRRKEKSFRTFSAELFDELPKLGQALNFTT